jgi:putative ABC transport system substrate-binding protein
VLWLPETEWLLPEAETAARLLGFQVEPRRIDSVTDLDAAFEDLARRRVAAVVGTQAPFFSSFRKHVAEAALRHRLPMISGDSGFAAAGGFAAFGPDIAGNWRRAATYVDKILKGANPADLPIEQPTPRFEINRKTAETLGITVPQSILLRADEVIE